MHREAEQSKSPADPPPRSPVGLEKVILRRIPVPIVGTTRKTASGRVQLSVELGSASSPDEEPHVLRYTGFEPGEYDLRDYLVFRDSADRDRIPPIRVVIDDVLSADAGAALNRSPEPLVNVTRLPPTVEWVGLAVWLPVFIVLIFLFRRRGSATHPSGPKIWVDDSTAKLLAEARRGRLTADGRLAVHGKLFASWRRDPRFAGRSLRESLDLMVRDEAFAERFAALEHWSHEGPDDAPIPAILASDLEQLAQERLPGDVER